MKEKKVSCEVDFQDENRYRKSEAWGISTMVDLVSCDPSLIRDPHQIKKFVIDLCDFIKMKRFGDPQIVHFGLDPKVSGYSMTQLIETSLVTAHFVEVDNSVHIDIFSCKFYPPFATAKFCEEFFKASSGIYKSEFRGGKKNYQWDVV